MVRIIGTEKKLNDKINATEWKIKQRLCSRAKICSIFSCCLNIYSEFLGTFFNVI